MSNNALFFWSKKATSSLYYKSIIIQNKLNINIVSVDNSKIRELLTNSKYPIKQIPSLLVINGNDFRLYSGDNLKIWFDKFFETIALDNNTMNNELTNNYSELPSESAPIKPVMNRQQLSENYRSTLSSPGIEFNGNTSLTLIPESVDNDNSKFIMTNRGIGKPPKKQIDEEYEEEIESAESLRPSKLKNNSISAAELADQLKSQREEMEQQLEENRPFD